MTEADCAMLMFTSVLPSAQASNAGARYVQWVLEATEERYSTFVVAPDGPASHRAQKSGQVPAHRLVGSNPGTLPAILDRLINRALALGLPVIPPWRYARDIHGDHALHQMIRSAKVIDLQWQEQAALIPLVRRHNPDVRIICTLHDVLSQRFGRAKARATSAPQRLRWRWAEVCALRSERKIVRFADSVVVFSEKDAQLLPEGPAEVHVVTPPLASGTKEVDRSSPIPGEILFVGLLSRWENEEGLLWFLAEILPRIKTSVPEARFRIAGLGASSRLIEAARDGGAEVLGFVPDLDLLYERASVVVVPLRLGAGVKFKVVDALVAGVPVVTTGVGAEGIGEESWFAGLENDAEKFASSVVAVLADSPKANDASQSIRRQVSETYGMAAFREVVGRIYDPAGSRSDGLR